MGLKKNSVQSLNESPYEAQFYDFFVLVVKQTLQSLSEAILPNGCLFARNWKWSNHSTGAGL